MQRTKEQIRKAIFGKLTGLRRKLNAHGIPCVYARSVLSHEDGDNSFKITYEGGGDNGETTLLPKLTLCTGQAVENFDDSNFEHGLARVKELFKAQKGHTEAGPSPAR